MKNKSKKQGENINNDDEKLLLSDVISSFFLHYHNKYEGKKIKFIVDKNATVSYGEGKYIMIVEEGKGYDTVLEMFFLEKDKMIRSN